ncbi:MAG: hypothetical protein N3E52_02075 [Candidatus Bathyarchaeota archaeon]|nr:hypothetical protein [Candidatus Bathyarchaeota archaeon]
MDECEDVVKDLMDNYVGLSHTRGGRSLWKRRLPLMPSWSMWIRLSGISWSNMEGSSVTPGTGMVGYDFRVTPDGKFEFFRRTRKSAVSVSAGESRMQSTAGTSAVSVIKLWLTASLMGKAV